MPKTAKNRSPRKKWVLQYIGSQFLTILGPSSHMARMEKTQVKQSIRFIEEYKLGMGNRYSIVYYCQEHITYAILHFIKACSNMVPSLPENSSASAPGSNNFSIIFAKNPGLMFFHFLLVWNRGS